MPAEDVRRRFERSIRNSLLHYRSLADAWPVFDNTPAPQKSASCKLGPSKTPYEAPSAPERLLLILKEVVGVGVGHGALEHS